MRLTFAAQYRESATQYPELQVWRNMTGTFVKVGNTGNMEPVQTAYLNVYEYVLDPPLPVLAGDVLGIYQPPENESRVHLTFLRNTGPVNWYRSSVTGPLATFVNDTQTQRNMLPLVVVNFEPDGELNLLHTQKNIYCEVDNYCIFFSSTTNPSVPTSSFSSPPTSTQEPHLNLSTVPP